MKIYAFKSRNYADVFGFTNDLGGDNLPFEFRPWDKQGQHCILSNSISDDGPGSDPLSTVIKKNGFCVVRAITIGVRQKNDCRE